MSASTDEISEHTHITDSIYDETISEVKRVAISIPLTLAGSDGRIASAVGERPFLEKLKELLLELHPTWEIEIAPVRANYDVMINGIHINLKLTDGKSADNSCNKPSIIRSITGSSDYRAPSNWNTFIMYIIKNSDSIKRVRDRMSEYHYLVKHKSTGDVLLKSIFDIHKYIDNPINYLQINWGNEFKNAAYMTSDDAYLSKVKELLNCLKTSATKEYDNIRKFIETDIDQIIPE